MTIFLSHTLADKPVVEPVALRLAGIFGQEAVFYDSWSIQPGDGIIKRMNEGLDAPEFVFFFVSAASLKSKMVELEWQNALYQSTKGKTRIVPVRVDGTEMPPLLMQNVYLDMFSNGIEATIQQIVGLTQGMNSFAPQHAGFSNLTLEVTPMGSDKLEICISASHLLEPDPAVIVLSDHGPNELDVLAQPGGAQQESFHPKEKITNGPTTNGFFVNAVGRTISPGKPLRLLLTNKTGGPVQFHGVLHRKSETGFERIPPKA